MEIIPVSTVDEVLAKALVGPLSPIEWSEVEEGAVVTPAAEDLDGDLVLTH
jgi:ATP-dependent Lon protease